MQVFFQFSARFWLFFKAARLQRQRGPGWVPQGAAPAHGELQEVVGPQHSVPALWAALGGLEIKNYPRAASRAGEAKRPLQHPRATGTGRTVPSSQSTTQHRSRVSVSPVHMPALQQKSPPKITVGELFANLTRNRQLQQPQEGDVAGLRMEAALRASFPLRPSFPRPRRVH